MVINLLSRLGMFILVNFIGIGCLANDASPNSLYLQKPELAVICLLNPQSCKNETSKAQEALDLSKLNLNLYRTEKAQNLIHFAVTYMFMGKDTPQRRKSFNNSRSSTTSLSVE